MGAGVAVVLAVFYGLRHHTVNVAAVALDFLAVFGLLAAANLIWAAFRGDPAKLPSAWREYVAVAGVVGMGFACQHLSKTIASLARKPVEAALTEQPPMSTIPDETQPNTESRVRPSIVTDDSGTN